MTRGSREVMLEDYRSRPLEHTTKLIIIIIIIIIIPFI